MYGLYLLGSIHLRKHNELKYFNISLISDKSVLYLNLLGYVVFIDFRTIVYDQWVF